MKPRLSLSGPVIFVLCSLTLYRSSSTSDWFILDYNSNFNADSPGTRYDSRTVFLDATTLFQARSGRMIQQYPIQQTDQTQGYPMYDSNDVEGIERRIFPAHDLQDEQCVPAEAWQSTIFPTCNDVHGLDMNDSLHNDVARVLSNKGFWRTAWELNAPGDYNHTSSLVLKTFKLQHAMEEAFFEQARVDALSMERLTKSKYVVDIFAHCGMTVLTEFAGKEVQLVADKLLPLERLILAERVAQGIADVHAIGLVHNDLNFANVVFGETKMLPLVNDFNLSVLRFKNKVTGESCSFTSTSQNAIWRAPEEMPREDGSYHPVLDEKIDVYGLGNIFFRFATGHAPWKKIGSTSLSRSEKRDVEHMKRQGQLPVLPTEFLQKDDPATIALLGIMNQCFAFHPSDRPSAMQVVQLLHTAIEDITEQVAMKTRTN